MSCVRASIAFSLLVSVAAAAMPQAERAVSLTVDARTHTLGVVSELDGTLFLALGPRAVPPIKIAGIELDVVPHFVLALGRVVAGDTLELAIPQGVRSLEAEGVLVDDRLGLHDSNVVALAGVVADLIEATFEAALIDDAGADPRYYVCRIVPDDAIVCPRRQSRRTIPVVSGRDHRSARFRLPRRPRLPQAPPYRPGS